MSKIPPTIIWCKIVSAMQPEVTCGYCALTKQGSVFDIWPSCFKAANSAWSYGAFVMSGWPCLWFVQREKGVFILSHASSPRHDVCCPLNNNCLIWNTATIQGVLPFKCFVHIYIYINKQMMFRCILKKAKKKFWVSAAVRVFILLRKTPEFFWKARCVL